MYINYIDYVAWMGYLDYVDFIEYMDKIYIVAGRSPQVFQDLLLLASEL